MLNLPFKLLPTFTFENTQSIDFITDEVYLMLFTDPHQIKGCFFAVNISQGIVRVAVEKGFHSMPSFFQFFNVIIHSFSTKFGSFMVIQNYSFKYFFSLHNINYYCNTGCPTDWYPLSISIPDFSDGPIKKKLTAILTQMV